MANLNHSWSKNLYGKWDSQSASLTAGAFSNPNNNTLGFTLTSNRVSLSISSSITGFVGINSSATILITSPLFVDSNYFNIWTINTGTDTSKYPITIHNTLRTSSITGGSATAIIRSSATGSTGIGLSSMTLNIFSVLE